MTSGRASPRFPLLHRFPVQAVVPLLASPAAGGEAAGVIGLACTTDSSPAASAHSMSTGWSYSFSIASPTRASSPAWPGESTAAERRPAGVSAARTAVASTTVIVSLLPVW